MSSRTFTSSGTDYLGSNTPPVVAYPFTMFAWATRDSITDATPGDLLGITVTDGVNNNSFSIRTNATYNAQAIARDTSTSGVLSTTAVSAIDTWFNVCGVFTSATARAIFLNGGGKGTTGTDKTPVGTISFLRVGYHGDTPHQGRIAHCAIWNVALTDEEAAALGSGVSPLSIRPASLKFYLPYVGRDSPEIDIIGGTTLTVTGTTINNDSPPLIFPYSLKDRISEAVPKKVSQGSSRFFDNTAVSTFSYSAWDGAWDIDPPFTVACWFWATGGSFIPTNDDLTMWSSGKSSTAAGVFTLSVGGVATAIFAATRQASWVSASSTAAPTMNTWQHACGVWTSSSLRDVYLNGGNKGTNASLMAVTAGRNQFNWGALRRNSVIDGMQGFIACPAVWSVALTANEILSLANGANPLLIRPQSLLWHSPNFGRDANDIDIIGGRNLTNFGSSARSENAPVKGALGRRIKVFKGKVTTSFTQFVNFMVG